MPVDIALHFQELVRPLFPEGARIKHLENRDGVSFLISWKLNTDPMRPNKRSRRIVFVLSEEFVEDYRDDSEAGQSQRDSRVRAAVSERLGQFEADHDAPYGSEEPEETWVIS